MSTFFSLLSPRHIIMTVIATVKRFPLPFIYILLTVSGFFAEIVIAERSYSDYTYYNTIRDLIGKGIISCIASFFLSLGLTLATEKWRIARAWKILILSWVLIFSVAYYYVLSMKNIESTETITMIFSIFFGFVMWLGVGPWTRKVCASSYVERTYVHYLYSISLAILGSVVIGALLMILGSIALWSIDTLFSITFSDAYAYLATVSFALVAPLSGLARIPPHDSILMGEGEDPRFFTFLIQYIAMPFIVLYFLILYVYSIDVLIHFSEWPKGQVSWLVIAFSIFAYKIYVFSYNIGNKDGLIARLRRYIPYIVLPQIFMLFYAIMLRIMQYDLTMNRYFVVVFGLWLLGVTLYFIFSREKRLIMLPVSIALLTVLISFGPWSVYQYPLTRQYERLIHNLASAGIYRDGTITPLEKYESIDAKLSQEIYEGIGYICDFDDCRQIRTLFAAEIAQAEAEKKTRWDASEVKYQKCISDSPDKGGCYRDEYSEELSRWEIQSTIALQIKVRNSPYSAQIPQVYSFWLDANRDDIFPLEVRGYDRIMKVMGKDIWNSEKYRDIVFFDIAKGVGELKIDGNVVEIYSLDNLEKSLLSLQGDTPSWDAVRPSRDQMTYTLSGVAYDMEIHLQSINIPNPAYSGSDMSSNSVDGYALIRKK